MGIAVSVINFYKPAIDYYDQEPSYILQIDIDELTQDKLWNIRRKIRDLPENDIIDGYVDKIIKTLQYVLDSNHSQFISCIDYYLFTILDIETFQIVNVNAKKNKIHNNINIQKYVCVKCNLDKV